MTENEKHKDIILTGQRESLPDVFYFSPNRTFLKTILASRTNGTFAFAPAAQAEPSTNAKEPFFATALIRMVNLAINITDIKLNLKLVDIKTNGFF